ncbi:MAG: CHC2 zinc finger domain-containing protein [Clostridiales bacterium]|nr:CHC2 zinc finger domain-containing protein [Clostridiales bacterium]
MPDAARLYIGGEKIRRGGKICCPFHNDRTPSMQLNGDYFYCYGCHAHGDVIALVAKLYDLEPLAAAKKLNRDFNLGLDVGRPLTEGERDHIALRRAMAVEDARFQRWRTDTANRLAGAWRTCNELSRIDPDALTPQQLKAVKVKDRIDGFLDALEDDMEAKNLFYEQRPVMSALLTVREAMVDE